MIEQFDTYASQWDTTPPREWSWHQWLFAAALSALIAAQFMLIGLLVLSL